MKLCSACRRCYPDAFRACVGSDHPALTAGPPIATEIAGTWVLERLLSTAPGGGVFLGRRRDRAGAVLVVARRRPILQETRPFERFLKETEALSTLHGAAVARVEQFGRLADGGAYAVLNPPGEETLREALDREGPLPVDLAASVARRVAEAVAALEEKELSAGALPSDRVGLTRSDAGEVLVTLARLPGEADGEEPGRGIFRLGELLYEMLAGRPPDRARGAVSLPQLQRMRPDLPAPLGWLVMQCLHPHPAARPRSAAEIAAKLRSFEKAATTSTVAAAQAAITAEIPALRARSDPPAPPPPPQRRATPASPAPVAAGPRSAEASPPPRPIPSPAPSLPAAAPIPHLPAASAAPASPVPARAEPPLPSGGPALRGDTAADPGAGGRVPRGARAAGIVGGTLAAAIGVAGAFWLILEATPPRRAYDHPAAVLRRTEAPSPAASALAPARVPERPLPAAPDSVVRAAPPSDGAAGASTDASAGSLRNALDAWLDSTNDRDLSAHMRFYMPRVATFYLARNISRERVRREKARLFRAGAVEVRAGEPEIERSPEGRSATVRFRKRYAIAGPHGRRRGEVLQEMRWVATREGWKIVGERDAKVLASR